MMKKIFSVFIVLFVGLMSSAFASNDFTPFTTIEQAQQYCPAVNGLTFTSNNLMDPKSIGSITGNNQVVFESIPPKIALHPKNMDTNSLITEAEFRSADGIYGYISNNIITCLYSYTTIYNMKYNFVMRG